MIDAVPPPVPASWTRHFIMSNWLRSSVAGRWKCRTIHLVTGYPQLPRVYLARPSVFGHLGSETVSHIILDLLRPIIVDLWACRFYGAVFSVQTLCWKTTVNGFRPLDFAALALLLWVAILVQLGSAKVEFFQACRILWQRIRPRSHAIHLCAQNAEIPQTQSTGVQNCKCGGPSVPKSSM